MDKAMNDTIKLVHSTLEYFKYIGGEREGEKTGEGVDVEIIVLPDLVLDFRAKNIDGRPTHPNGPCKKQGSSSRNKQRIYQLQATTSEPCL